jgi:hypothetical protein
MIMPVFYRQFFYHIAMSLDYAKVWEVMNDLDEVIEQCKIIQQMSQDLGEMISHECDDDVILNSVMTLTGVSEFMHRKLQNSSNLAWKHTVVPLKKSTYESFSNAGTSHVSSRTFENSIKTGMIDLS